MFGLPYPYPKHVKVPVILWNEARGFTPRQRLPWLGVRYWIDWGTVDANFPVQVGTGGRAS